MFFFSATTILNADATIRYKRDIKLSATSLPIPGAQQMFGSQKSSFPPLVVIQIKGDKAYSNAGLGSSLLDFTKQQITVINATDKLFATVYVKDFIGAAIPSMPPVAPAVQKFLASMKSNFAITKTGRTDVILGIQVEESELTISIEWQVPTDVPLPPGMFQPGENVTFMKMVTQIWTAAPGEVLRLPALAELAAHTSSTGQLMLPAAAMQQSFANFPGFGYSWAAMMDEFSKHSTPMLKSHSATYMPMMARLMQQLRKAQGQPPPTAGLDPDAPFMETNIEVLDISDAAIDDSAFEVPTDYHSTTLPEVLKSLMPASAAPGVPATSLPANP